MYSFQINLIFNCVLYDSKCPILSPTHTCKKGPVIPSLKRKRCVTPEEKLFQTRVRCFQHSSLSRAPSTPIGAEHLTLARNSSFSPLVAQRIFSWHRGRKCHIPVFAPGGNVVLSTRYEEKIILLEFRGKSFVIKNLISDLKF